MQSMDSTGPVVTSPALPAYQLPTHGRPSKHRPVVLTDGSAAGGRRHPLLQPLRLKHSSCGPPPQDLIHGTSLSQRAFASPRTPSAPERYVQEHGLESIDRAQQECFWWQTRTDLLLQRRAALSVSPTSCSIESHPNISSKPASSHRPIVRSAQHHMAEQHATPEFAHEMATLRARLHIAQSARERARSTSSSIFRRA